MFLLIFGSLGGPRDVYVLNTRFEVYTTQEHLQDCPAPEPIEIKTALKGPVETLYALDTDKEPCVWGDNYKNQAFKLNSCDENVV